jgi:metal-sulfur cluster biosynthetic enzyme
VTAREEVLDVLRAVIDPELGIDVVALGLIYDVAIDEHAGRVDVLMTLTVKGCPMHATIARDVDAALRSLLWVRDVAVRLTFDPPWSPARLSDEARALLAR